MSSTSKENFAREHFAALNRRQFLRGLGACVALPTLETFLPRPVLASSDPGTQLAVTSTGAPLRFGVVYFPNGRSNRAGGPKARMPSSNSGRLCPRCRI